MPKTNVRKSAVKTQRNSEKARIRNKSCRNKLATMEKSFRAAAAGALFLCFHNHFNTEEGKKREGNVGRNAFYVSGDERSEKPTENKTDTIIHFKTPLKTS